MIKCPNCGYDKNNDNAKFCSECGKTLEKKQEMYVYRDDSNPKQKTCESPISPDMIMQTVNKDDGYSFEAWLSSISIEKKWKIFLKRLHDKYIWVGEKLVPIGQYIVKIVSKIAYNFSGMITGALVGGIIGILFSMIPLIGWILGPMITSIFVFGGALAGFIKDLIDKLPVEGQEAIKNNIVKVCSAAGYIGV